jgi:hypothetical protein
MLNPPADSAYALTVRQRPGVVLGPIADAAHVPSRGWFAILWPLCAVIAACLPLRLLLARGERLLLQPLSDELLARPWLLLLPFDFGGHRYRWSPTGHVVLGLLNLVCRAPVMFVLFLLILVIVAYLLSYAALRSRAFSTTLALGMAFGTQFNFAYHHNGGIIWILYTLYLLIHLYFLHALATEPSPRRRTRIGFVVSLIVFALCWEQWLDYLAFVIAGCVLSCLLCRRDAALWARYRGRIGYVVLCTLLVTAGYLAVKLPYATEHLTPGHESDTVFTYSSWIMAVEDIGSNVATYSYIALTNFCPSWLSSSNSLYHFGADRIIAEQHGYHAEKTHLVAMHHEFLWYFNAGAVLVIFVHLSYRVGKQAWQSPGQATVLLAVLVLMIWTGFATHTIIKYRPYLSVPLLAYKCMVSVVAVALLVAYAAMRSADWFRNRRLYLAAMAALWLAIIFVGVERMPYQAHLCREVGLGDLPDPVQMLQRSVQKHF